MSNPFRRAESAIALLIILMFAIGMMGCSHDSGSKTLILATTTSVNDSGLLGILKPEFEKDTGLQMKIIAQGSGQAIKTAQQGDADALLVHSKQAELDFVAAGFGLKRIELMYNYFILVGPKEDPAGILKSSEMNAPTALKMIMDQKASFVSRGDNSGTYNKELALWTSLKIKPTGDWYVSAGKGMGEVLSMASEKKAYTLTDKATYLSMKDKLDLTIVLENAQDLKNQYTMIEVNPDKVKGVNKKNADQWIQWMTSAKALKMIQDYGQDKYHESLFTVNYGK